MRSENAKVIFDSVFHLLFAGILFRIYFPNTVYITTLCKCFWSVTSPRSGVTQRRRTTWRRSRRQAAALLSPVVFPLAHEFVRYFLMFTFNSYYCGCDSNTNTIADASYIFIKYYISSLAHKSLLRRFLCSLLYVLIKCYFLILTVFYCRCDTKILTDVTLKTVKSLTSIY